MSEKMDGVRAYWNGNELLSRTGLKFHSPLWFTKAIPSDVTLDGELWLGPVTSFVDITKVLKAKDGNWSAVGYFIFDLPSSPGTYEQRMLRMEELELPSHAHIVKNIQCKGAQHSQEYLSLLLE